MPINLIEGLPLERYLGRDSKKRSVTFGTDEIDPTPLSQTSHVDCYLRLTTITGTETHNQFSLQTESSERISFVLSGLKGIERELNAQMNRAKRISSPTKGIRLRTANNYTWNRLRPFRDFSWCSAEIQLQTACKYPSSVLPTKSADLMFGRERT